MREWPQAHVIWPGFHSMYSIYIYSRLVDRHYPPSSIVELLLFGFIKQDIYNFSWETRVMDGSSSIHITSSTFIQYHHHFTSSPLSHHFQKCCELHGVLQLCETCSGTVASYWDLRVGKVTWVVPARAATWYMIWEPLMERLERWDILWYNNTSNEIAGTGWNLPYLSINHHFLLRKTRKNIQNTQHFFWL